MKIVLLTMGQPSTNPRLVKEYLALKKAGYQVKVIYAFWTRWALRTDSELFENNILNAVDFVLVGGQPISKKGVYFFSRFIFKIFKIVGGFIPISIFKEWSMNRSSVFIEFAAKREKADLYIVHSLGALPGGVRAAVKNKAKVSIDFEDYFSGQWPAQSPGYLLSQRIENKYLDKVQFSTAASPLIGKKYKENFPFLSPVTINNVFSKKYIQQQGQDYFQGNVLKLFWFSQTVGMDRGLEELIEALGSINLNVSFSILGSCDLETKMKLISKANVWGIREAQLVFIDPVAPDKIFEIAREHHIGVALESDGSVNRQICLTNKIFTYLCCGLAIIATDTTSQKQFLDYYENIGKYYPKGNVIALSELIKQYQSNATLLNFHRTNALKLASGELNWELEQSKFLNLIKENIF